jgi:hypothetical protein
MIEVISVLSIMLVVCIWNLGVLRAMQKIFNAKGRILHKLRMMLNKISLNLEEQRKDFDILTLMHKYDSVMFGLNLDKYLKIKEHRESLDIEYHNMYTEYKKYEKKYKRIEILDIKWNNRLIFCKILSEPKKFWVK